MQVSHSGLDHFMRMNVIPGLQAVAIAGDDAKNLHGQTGRQIGTPPGGEREVWMTHRGARRLATRRYCATGLLGNKLNARGHGFRCSSASRIAFHSLISPHLASLA